MVATTFTNEMTESIKFGNVDQIQDKNILTTDVINNLKVEGGVSQLTLTLFKDMIDNLFLKV